ncbi:hypothetical protein Q8F55_007335 [Vanrija albida]|uniref:Major facilitator superfamily (MFS) profile domain-containing protein n=1 Tax=Vanrija albida TaxID=181172 RepID=A0ABR3PZK4_9TREE
MPSEYKGIHNNTAPQWWRDPSLRRNVVWVALCALCTVYGGFDGSLFGGLQAVPKWFEQFPALKNPDTLGLINACGAFPNLIMPLVGSWMGDRFGRRLPNIIAVIGVIAFAIMQAFSNTLGMWAAARVLITTFSALSAPTGPALLVELAHPRYRSTASALNMSGWYVGSIIGGWAGYGAYMNYRDSHWSWRLPCLIQFVIPTFVLVGFILIPESPRWLISKGRIEEARKVLAREHANGDENDPLVNFEMDEIQQALVEEKAINSTAGSWFSLFKTPGNRKRLFIMLHVVIGAQWCGNGVIGYYFVPVLKSVGITSASQQLLLNSGMNIWNLFLAGGAALTIERFGRRPLFLASTTGMLISMVVITGCSAAFSKTGNSSAGIAVVAFLFLFNGSYDIAMTPMNVAYNVEIFPFAIRSKGMGVWQVTQAVFIIYNSYVNPIALSKIHYWYYLVYVGILIYLTIIIYLFFPETKGLTLEEVAVKFDGPQMGELMHAQEKSEVDHVDDAASEDGKESPAKR